MEMKFITISIKFFQFFYAEKIIDFTTNCCRMLFAIFFLIAVIESTNNKTVLYKLYELTQIFQN